MPDFFVTRRADVPFRFQCNICDQTNETVLADLTREMQNCSRCGSTVRLRSIIQLLTTELFGQSLRISEIVPPRKDIVGIGMSCGDCYAIPLMQHLGYTNTFYHQAPLLDITSIDPSMEATLDFIISTDVFEHIEPPVSRAFVNAKKLLKPDGIFIFSVPFSDPGKPGVSTREHFPELHDYVIEQHDDGYCLKNTTRAGEVQYFDDLVFHGGPGTTLEMRLFSEASLIAELTDAGFASIDICGGSDLSHGIYWPHPWSVPMVARAGTRLSIDLPLVERDAALRAPEPAPLPLSQSLMQRLIGGLRASR